MPKFYMHLRDDLDCDDVEGLDLPDLGSARAAAVASARSILMEAVGHGHMSLKGRIDIADDSHRVVMTVPFGEAVTIDGLPHSAARRT